MSDTENFHKEPNYLPFDEFIKKFGQLLPKKMNTSIYETKEYQCGCGKKHLFDSRSVYCEGFTLRMLVGCPDDPRYLTNIKVKTGFLMMGFKGFESISSTYIKDLTPEEFLSLLTKKILH